MFCKVTHKRLLFLAMRSFFITSTELVLFVIRDFYVAKNCIVNVQYRHVLLCMELFFIARNYCRTTVTHKNALFENTVVHLQKGLAEFITAFYVLNEMITLSCYLTICIVLG